MKERVVACTLLLLVAAVAADRQCVCQFSGGAGWGGGGRHSSASNSRLDGQEARISRLSTQLHDLNQRMDTTVTRRDDVLQGMRDLKARIGVLEGSGCNSHQFQCGGDAHRCISDLLVCDGTPDCANEHDEDSNVCEVLTPAGSRWEADLDIHNYQCSSRFPDHVTLIISRVRRVSYFQARLQIEGHLIETFHDHDGEDTVHFDVHGFYDFAHGHLVIDPPQSDRLEVTCDFDGVHTDHCHAHLVHEDSLEPCADFEFHLQH